MLVSLDSVKWSQPRYFVMSKKPRASGIVDRYNGSTSDSSEVDDDDKYTPFKSVQSKANPALSKLSTRETKKDLKSVKKHLKDIELLKNKQEGATKSFENEQVM